MILRRYTMYVTLIVQNIMKNRLLIILLIDTFYDVLKNIQTEELRDIFIESFENMHLVHTKRSNDNILLL